MAGPQVNKMCCLGGYVGKVYTTTCGWCHRPPPQPTLGTHPIFTLLRPTEEKLHVKST